MSKHTPGPWNYRACLEILKHGQGPGSMHENIEADAKLMSVCPEMLELLKDYQAFYETYAMQDMTSEELEGEVTSEVYRKILAKRKRIAEVIAKAEGREK